eukprot:TRINITY_DN197_c0_g1_i3.p1 TRINITY_DN197_c0_g1~~TRINITY_DN197_c0_g1_i3.p1  ORF type:complete len:126 (-),score=8.14 TRINITY_DN197_c0_g1_i3:196-573(-)
MGSKAWKRQADFMQSARGYSMKKSSPSAKSFCSTSAQALFTIEQVFLCIYSNDRPTNPARRTSCLTPAKHNRYLEDTLCFLSLSLPFFLDSSAFSLPLPPTSLSPLTSFPSCKSRFTGLPNRLDD